MVLSEWIMDDFALTRASRFAMLTFTASLLVLLQQSPMYLLVFAEHGTQNDTVLLDCGKSSVIDR